LNSSFTQLKNSDFEAIEMEEKDLCKKIDEFFSAMKLL